MPSTPQRLGYDLIGMSVNPALSSRASSFPLTISTCGRSSANGPRRPGNWCVPAGRQGIHSKHVVKFGVAGAVKDLNHEVKRIDFVITDVGIKSEEITGEIPLPVFSISGYRGEKIMARNRESANGEAGGQDHCPGIGSVAIYARVF